MHLHQLEGSDRHDRQGRRAQCRQDFAFTAASARSASMTTPIRRCPTAGRSRCRERASGPRPSSRRRCRRSLTEPGVLRGHGHAGPRPASRSIPVTTSTAPTPTPRTRPSRSSRTPCPTRPGLRVHGSFGPFSLDDDTDPTLPGSRTFTGVGHGVRRQDHQRDGGGRLDADRSARRAQSQATPRPSQSTRVTPSPAPSRTPRTRPSPSSRTAARTVLRTSPSRAASARSASTTTPIRRCPRAAPSRCRAQPSGPRR